MQDTISNAARKIQVDPHSKPAQLWDAFSAVALVSIAVLTPFEVAFLDTPLLSSWWWFNRAIDLVRHICHNPFLHLAGLQGYDGMEKCVRPEQANVACRTCS
jgi:hypothetical protein